MYENVITFDDQMSSLRNVLIHLSKQNTSLKEAC